MQNKVYVQPTNSDFSGCDIDLYEFFKDSLECSRRRHSKLNIQRTNDDENESNFIQIERYSIDTVFEMETYHKGVALFEKLFYSNREKFEEEYVNRKKKRGQFAVILLGIPEIRSEIGKYLNISNWIILNSICKNVYTSLVHYPDHLKVFKMSLQTPNLRFTLEFLQTYPLFDPTTHFYDIENNDYINIGTALSSACHYGDMLLFRYLFDELHIDPSVEDNLAIQLASSEGNFEILSLLLEDSRVDPSAEDNSAIQYASRNGHLFVVCKLLEDERVDPSAEDNSAIQYASRNGHLFVVCKLLEDERVDVTVDNNFAICWASRNGYFDVVCRLLEDERVDVTADNNFAIRWASKNGHFDLATKILIDSRIDFDEGMRIVIDSNFFFRL